MSKQPPLAPGASVHRLVPFVYVADIESSLTYYSSLGFAAREILRDPDGKPNWAWVETGPGGTRGVVAQLMFSRTWRPIEPSRQDIFFYLYTLDLAALRERLLAGGVHDGGSSTAWDVPDGAPRAGRTLFAIHYPSYMPAGEMRVHDPDGYCLLIGQLDEPIHEAPGST